MSMPRAVTTIPQESGSLTGEPPVESPSVISGPTTGAEPGPLSAPAMKMGPLLDEPDETKVAKTVSKLWTKQDAAMKSRLARWEVNAARRAGNPWVRLVKDDQDTDSYRAYTPPGASSAPQHVSKTAILCRKFVATMTVDPPIADCEPPSDSDEDRAAAEFSTRVLADQAGEHAMNIAAILRVSEDKATVYGSTFVRPFVDPTGAGYRPKEIMATPHAVSVDDPFAADPVTGVMGDPILRYATDGGQIVDDPQQAAMEWLPKLRHESLTGKNLRFLPPTARNIADAEGCVIAAFISLGQLKVLFPDSVGTMKPDDLRALVKYRPAVATSLVPKGTDLDGTKIEGGDKSEGPPDDALVLTYTCYYRSHPTYPKGAYVIVGADKFVLHRQTWTLERTVNGKTVEEPMDIPVAQFKQFEAEDGTDDPYGRGLVDLVGDGDGIMASALGTAIELMGISANRRPLIPIGSGIHEKTYKNTPSGDPIFYNPSGGGKIEWEPEPTIPPIIMEIHDRIDRQMTDAAAMEDSATGRASSASSSGKKEQILVERALVMVSGPKQNMDDGTVRLFRIMLQHMARDFTQPQMLRVVGEDGEYKYKEWTKADLGSTKDVKIAPGSSTMLEPAAKRQLAQEDLAIATANMDSEGYQRYQRTIAGNMQSKLGRQDDPVLMRVRKQISDWSDGPQDGWAPPPPQMGVDPTTGQPVPMAVPDPMNPFADVRSVDQEPLAAKARHGELARAYAGSKFGKFDPVWQGYLVAEYESMRQAAGIQTIAEQQAAQAAQAQAAAQERMAMASMKQPAAKEEQAEDTGIQPGGGAYPTGGEAEQQAQAVA